MPKIKFRTVYTAREEDHRGITFSSDSLAQQHFRDECDVNKIVARYVKTGVMEHLSDVPPHYGDVSEIPIDLMAAYEAVGRAEAAFMDLPSDLRKSLNNDPSQLSAWLQNPDNRADAVRYGLMNPPSSYPSPSDPSPSDSEKSNVKKSLEPSADAAS